MEIAVNVWGKLYLIQSAEHFQGGLKETLNSRQSMKASLLIMIQ